MVTLRTVEPHRATVADAAGSDRSVRLTWHAEVQRFTLTHWRGLVCVAQVEVAPEDASELLAVLAEGVADAMPRWLTPDEGPSWPPPRPGAPAEAQSSLDL